MNATCPVCRNPIRITTVQHWVWPHNDKVGTDCPQGRKPLRLDESYEVAS